MSDLKPKKKPRGRPFVKGQRANPHGRPKKSIASADDLFLDEFFREVDAKKGGLRYARRNTNCSWNK